MADRPLDQRFEKLVALLYGELPQDEQYILRAEIERDPALREAWEEISAARAFLREAPEEPAPSFVFLDESRAPARRRLPRIFLVLAPWAAAAAAVVVAVFAMNEARLARRAAERTSSPPAAVASIAPSPTDERPGALPASIGSSAPEQQAAGPASAGYMTRREFEAYSAGVTQTMTALLNEYGKQRDGEIASVLQIALSDLADRQNRDYRDLTGRIENVAQGLADEQFRTNLQVDYLLREDQQPVSPARRSVSDQ